MGQWIKKYYYSFEMNDVFFKLGTQWSGGVYVPFYLISLLTVVCTNRTTRNSWRPVADLIKHMLDSILHIKGFHVILCGLQYAFPEGHLKWVLQLCQQSLSSPGMDPLLPSRPCLFKAGSPVTWHVWFKDCQFLIKCTCSLGFASWARPKQTLEESWVSSKPPVSHAAL